MPYVSSQLPATPLQASLSTLTSGIARMGGFLSTLAPLGRSLTLQNQANALPASPPPDTLLPADVVFQELPSAAGPSARAATPTPAGEQMDHDELSGSDLANTREALVCMKEVLKGLTGDEEKRQCQAQIDKLQALMPGRLPLVRFKEIGGRLMNVANRVAMAAQPLSRDAAPAPLQRCGIPTFSTLAASPEHENGMAGLFVNLSLWCNSHINAISTHLKHNAEQRDILSSTPRPPSYTRLERSCFIDRSSSLVKRMATPSSSDTVRKLLGKAGEQFNPNAGHYGAAHQAVLSNHPKRLEALLRASKGQIEVDRVSPAYDATALELAIEHDNAACATLLLDAGAAPTARVFQLLVLKGEVDMFKRLHAGIKARVERDISLKRAVAPVDFHPALANAVNRNALGIAAFLLENGEVLGPDAYAMLQLAANRGHAAMLDLLFQHVPQRYETLCNNADGEYTPLALAMRGGHVDAAAVLLEKQADRGFVREAAAYFNAEVAKLSAHERTRLAPIQALLRNWLDAAPLTAGSNALRAATLQLAIADDAANEPDARMDIARTQSSRVFAFSDALAPAMRM